MPADPALRTPAVTLALDLVRDGGGSAHPARGQFVSDIAATVAVRLNRNPVTVQREITRYADAQDAAVRESLAVCREQRRMSVMDADG